MQPRDNPLRVTPIKMDCRAYLDSLNSHSSLDIIRRGLEHIEFENLISKSDRIFIKPNLTYPSYKPGVMTSPQAVEAAIIALREYTPHIFIGDSDGGGYNRFSINEVYRETGISRFAKEYGVQVVNLSHGPVKPIRFHYQHKNFELNLPKLLTDEIDLLVTMPVPKVHANSGVSLTFKNQWGCIPENRDRLRLHPYLPHVILEVCQAVKAKIAIVDGAYGLNINGPMRGQAVKLDWMLVTNDIGAGARIACELMQVPLERIPHLNYARKMGFVPELNQITINQNLASFTKTKFVLKRKWTDYPGLLAYKVPLLAYVAYFSPFSQILHRVLYWFREPFYDHEKYAVRRQFHD